MTDVKVERQCGGGETQLELPPIQSESSPEGSEPVHSMYHRVTSALFYAVCATLIVFVNKIVLTIYQFPSFLVLSLGQILITTIVVAALRLAGVVRFPSSHRGICQLICPLPLLFFGSIVFSLGGTQKLSIPMYVVLRRFGNVFIMLGEYFILGQVASKFVQLTVFLMIVGALIAASDDLSFNLEGYMFMLITNMCASLYGVLTKQKLNNNTLGEHGLMFYNSLVMALPVCGVALLSGDIHKAASFPDWKDPVFVLLFLLACVMGFLVSFSTLLSTKYNSALTTSIVGVLKNMIVVYSGMAFGGYTYSAYNLLGINISVAAGLLYTYAVFVAKSRSAPS